MVIQPSTGDILAVAQNTETGSGPVALNRLCPPGSTFKIATAAAIIEAGSADTDIVLSCLASATIGQRTIPNSAFDGLVLWLLPTVFTVVAALVFMRNRENRTGAE